MMTNPARGGVPRSRACRLDKSEHTAKPPEVQRAAGSIGTALDLVAAAGEPEIIPPSPRRPLLWAAEATGDWNLIEVVHRALVEAEIEIWIEGAEP